MKICFWIGSVYYRPGGTNVIVATIANKLALTHQVSLLVTHSPGKESLVPYHPSIEIIPHPTANKAHNSKKYHPQTLAQLEEFFNTQGYDIIVATAQEILWLAMLAPKLTAKTFGWQHNTYDAYLHTKNFMFWKKEPLLKKYIPQLNRLIVLSKYDVDAYKSHLNLDTLDINNCLTLKSAIKTDPAQKQFFMAGRFVPQKGMEYLIDAFNLFCKHNSEWRLVIAGDGPLRSKIIKRVWHHKIQDRVQFVGFKDNILPYYLASSIYLLTSRYEGWGLVVTEAFELGLPVIAFDITPMDIMIDHGENGIIVQKYNVKKYAAAMLKLAKDDALRQKMHQAAIKKANAFDVDAIVQQWEDVFNFS